MDLRRESYVELFDPGRSVCIEREVGVSGGNGVNLRLGLDPKRPLEPVHEPVGLCRRRPDVEMWVANQREPLGSHWRLEHVWARARDARYHLLFARHGGRNRIGERQCELVAELGVRSNEVERDRPTRVIGHDASGEVTRSGLLTARVAPDQPSVESPVVVSGKSETPFECTAEVGSCHDVTV
jgi:hypothetical protein